MTVAAIADHHGWAVIVTVAADGTVLDRQRAELVDPALPPSPFEHDAQTLLPDEAVALVREVEHSVASHVRALWNALSAEHGVTAVALREIPRLPATVEEQIRSYHARTRADSAMYRRFLAEDAESRGWAVDFYDHHRVIDEAAGTLGMGPDDLSSPRRDIGPPWTVDHRRAYAAARLMLHDLTGDH